MRRRRFLMMAACLVAGPARAAVARHRFRALGAAAELILPEGPGVAAAVAAVRREVAAVEAAVSLWRPSELVRLNRAGVLPAPGPHFRALFAEARAVSALSGGGFDVTVQPMWEGRAAPVGWQDMVAEGGAVRFRRPGMAATFNGIAQGYAADRAVAVLAAHGFGDVLVNLGEWRGAGAHPDGRPWAVGATDPAGTVRAVLHPGAVATSEPHATLVRGQPHIFDPLARPGLRWASVTVRAATAARADALSTAIAAAPLDKAHALLHAGAAAEAVLIPVEGGVVHWERADHERDRG